MIGWIARLLKRHCEPQGNGDAAQRARVEAQRRLDAAKGMWPQTRETRDLLAEWIDSALRGHR